MGIADQNKLSKLEFVTLMALMTSTIALAIDGMLPAFPQISSDFSVESPSKLLMIMTVLFLGFGFGQLFFGPLSDVYGRKKPVYFGLVIFIVGSLLSGFAESYSLFIFGRFLQGFGGAAPRIISLALIRDEYSGAAMAHITSLVMTVFFIVPAVALILGQTIMNLSSWRMFFIFLFLIGVIIWIWFGLRQSETLPIYKRKRLTLTQIKYGIFETFRHSITVCCMLVSGAVFGIFVGYLGAVQEIFSKIFNAEDNFPLYFAILAGAMGVASFSNSKVVVRIGMKKLVTLSLVYMLFLSSFFYIYLSFNQQLVTPLWLFMTYMVLLFLSIGFLFGNLNAMAMEPLGHIAGIGSALLSFVQSFISVVIGVIIGPYFYSSINPLVLSFAVMSFICLILFFIESKVFSKNI